jgi:hypothetical protein
VTKSYSTDPIFFVVSRKEHVEKGVVGFSKYLKRRQQSQNFDESINMAPNIEIIDEAANTNVGYVIQ